MHVASVPFCIPHIYKLKLDKYNYTKKFEKWNKLPYKAHMLYWKLHPKEYPF